MSFDEQPVVEAPEEEAADAAVEGDEAAEEAVEAEEPAAE